MLSDIDDFEPNDLLGERFGARWVLEEVLGSGGMSWVYRARDLQDDSIAALKILPSEDTIRQNRFLQETFILKVLNHPNIVQHKDAGFCKEQDLAFIAMEYIQAPSLDVLLDTREQRTMAYMFYILLPILNALHYIHTKGIIHRDLKPGNIAADPSRRYVRLFDFGISKILQQNLMRMTIEGEICGSPLFLAPEQIARKTLSPKTDLYAFGVMLYGILAGRLPFQGNNIATLCNQHLTQTPDDLSTLWAVDFPPHQALIELTHQLLEKKSSKRPKDAITVYQDLVHILRENRPLRRARFTHPKSEPPKRKPLHQILGSCDSHPTAHTHGNKHPKC